MVYENGDTKENIDIYKNSRKSTFKFPLFAFKLIYANKKQCQNPERIIF